MPNAFDTPHTISGKIRVRTPAQAESLSSRYVFLNLQNAEPNLGIPMPAGVKPDDYVGDPGIRYALLSNNNSGPLSGWRVWSYDTPRIATYSKQNSIGLGDNAHPNNNNSIVYSNYDYDHNNDYNSQSFYDNTFNVFSMSGIYLYDATTVGDPISATAFIVTPDGLVGINTDYPNQELTVKGAISGSGDLYISGNTVIGTAQSNTQTLYGNVRIANSYETPLVFGNQGGSFDVNLYRGGSNILQTDDKVYCVGLSSALGLSAADIRLTNATVSSIDTATTTGEFLIININGAQRALRLWN